MEMEMELEEEVSGRMEMEGRVKFWINEDESAKEMLARVLTERPVLMFPPPLHRVPLRAGNVLEISGPSPSAKTHILMQAAVNCIVPTEWNGIRYGGLGQLVLYIDLDCRFEISRLLEMLNYRLSQSTGCSSNNTDKWIGDKPSAAPKEVLDECMKRFLYTRCYDTFEFLAMLKTLHYQLQRETKSPGMRGQLLLIDSIGLFHWVDRAYSASAGVQNRKRFSLQNVWDTAVQDLRKLLSVHPMLVVASKATMLPSTVFEAERNFRRWNSLRIPDSRNEMDEVNKLPVHEYMPSVWQSLITHRILVQPSDDRINTQQRDCTSYSSEWLLPSLGFKDKFIVGDAGIFIA